MLTSLSNAALATGLLSAALATAAGGIACHPDDFPLLISYRTMNSTFRPLDRQAVLFGRTEVKVSVHDSCAGQYSLRWFSVGIGAEPLCLASGNGDTCEIDFGSDLKPWTLDIKASLIDRNVDRVIQRQLALTTLDAGLSASERRLALSRSGIAFEERTGAQRVPYDEIWRVALVLDKKKQPRKGLSRDEFGLRINGVKGEKLVEAVPISQTEGERLLFVLVDVSDYLLATRRHPTWKADYRSFVREFSMSLGHVTAPERKLLIVRYAGSAEASSIVGLDDKGIQHIEQWLCRPPLPDWKPEEADRTAALLQVYDVFLHDFHGQPLGVVISGGRNTPTKPGQIISLERMRELNPLWPAERLAGLIAELDLGRIDLFPHTEQHGFPLSWVYVPISKELTTQKFASASQYFRRFGGEVYRLASIRDPEGKMGHRASGGLLLLDDILEKMFDDLENSYLLRLHIPNPQQRRTERTIQVFVEDSTVRTQTFYRASEPLRDNIERYLSSMSKERRFRAAYAARNYPLDSGIYSRIEEWLPQESSSQVLPILEESKLVMDFKRGQAPEKAVRIRAFEKLFAISHEQLSEANRALLETLLDLAELMMRKQPELYGGNIHIERILAGRHARIP